MYCGKCGKQLPENAQFCGHCGSTVQRAGTEYKKTVSTAGKASDRKTGGSSAKMKIGLILSAAAVCLLIAAAALYFFVFRQTTIELDPYISVSFSGSNGEGYAVCVFDEERLTDDYGGKVSFARGASSDGETAMDTLIGCIGYRVTPDENLSNGDEVTLKWGIDDETISDALNCKVTFHAETYTVSGLPEKTAGVSEETSAFDEKTKEPEHEDRDIAESDDGTVRIGLSDDCYPISFASGGSCDGFAAELSRMIGDDLGWSYELVPVSSQSEMISMLDSELTLCVYDMEEDDAWIDYRCSGVFFDGNLDGTDYCMTFLFGEKADQSGAVNALLTAYQQNGTLEELTEKWQMNRVTEESSEYILPFSDNRYLTESDLGALSWEECCLARNEIYARHGRIFSTPEIAAYFNSQSWYYGTVPAERFNQIAVFNEYELANVNFINDYETRVYGGSYY